ncbi:MAG: TPM domain-containing protein [Rikenellaceae bacterium]
MKRFLAVFLLLLSLSVGVEAKVVTPEPMRPARLVNDFAGLFSPAQIQVLEDSLVSFARATSTQIAVVTMNDLNGYAPSVMAAGLIDNWGIGQADKDNGIVFLLKPRNDTRGEVFIGVGSGLEGVLPDGKAGRVIDGVMLAHLAKGEYYEAISKGTREVRGIVRGEFTAKYSDEVEWLSMLWPFLLVVSIIILSMVSNKGNKGGDNNRGGGGGFPWWLILLGSGGSGGRGGGYGGSGGGGFGGFGGGGSFGGGGGRSF